MKHAYIYLLYVKQNVKIFFKKLRKNDKKYQMMWMQEKRIHIYGKKGK